MKIPEERKVNKVCSHLFLANMGDFGILFDYYYACINGTFFIYAEHWQCILK